MIVCFNLVLKKKNEKTCSALYVVNMCKMPSLEVL